MRLFKEFLELLATPGGNLLILCVAVVCSGVAAVAVSNRSDQLDNFMLSIFSGFSGALLQALTSKHAGDEKAVASYLASLEKSLAEKPAPKA